MRLINSIENLNDKVIDDTNNNNNCNNKNKKAFFTNHFRIFIIILLEEKRNSMILLIKQISDQYLIPINFEKEEDRIILKQKINEEESKNITTNDINDKIKEVESEQSKLISPSKDSDSKSEPDKIEKKTYTKSIYVNNLY